MEVTSIVTIKGTTFSLGNPTVHIRNASRPDPCDVAGNRTPPVKMAQVFSPISASLATQMSEYATAPTLYWTQGGEGLAFVFQTKLTVSMNGSLSGTITRSNTAVPACSTYRISDTYETQSASVYDPFAFTPKFVRTPLQNDALSASIFAGADGNCKYMVTGLPKIVGMTLGLYYSAPGASNFSF